MLHQRCRFHAWLTIGGQNILSDNFGTVHSDLAVFVDHYFQVFSLDRLVQFFTTGKVGSVHCVVVDLVFQDLSQIILGFSVVEVALLKII